MSNWTEDDLVFVMVPLTPQKEEKAAQAAGMSQNFAAVFTEMQLMSIAKIGKHVVRGAGNKGRDIVQRWLNDLGPRGRKYVEGAFNRMSSVAEADMTSFLDSCEPTSV